MQFRVLTQATKWDAARQSYVDTLNCVEIEYAHPSQLPRTHPLSRARDFVSAFNEEECEIDVCTRDARWLRTSFPTGYARDSEAPAKHQKAYRVHSKKSEAIQDLWNIDLSECEDSTVEDQVWILTRESMQTTWAMRSPTCFTDRLSLGSKEIPTKYFEVQNDIDPNSRVRSPEWLESDGRNLAECIERWWSVPIIEIGNNHPEWLPSELLPASSNRESPNTPSHDLSRQLTLKQALNALLGQMGLPTIESISAFDRINLVSNRGHLWTELGRGAKTMLAHLFTLLMAERHDLCLLDDIGDCSSPAIAHRLALMLLRFVRFDQHAIIATSNPILLGCLTAADAQNEDLSFDYYKVLLARLVSIARDHPEAVNNVLEHYASNHYGSPLPQTLEEILDGIIESKGEEGLRKHYLRAMRKTRDHSWSRLTAYRHVQIIDGTMTIEAMRPPSTIITCAPESDPSYLTTHVLDLLQYHILMMELPDFKDRARAALEMALARPENMDFELKAGLMHHLKDENGAPLKYELVKEIVAFANARGGWLFIGILDDEDSDDRIVGLDLAKEGMSEPKHGSPAEKLAIYVDTIVGSSTESTHAIDIQLETMHCEGHLVLAIYVHANLAPVYFLDLKNNEQRLFYARGAAHKKLLQGDKLKAHIKQWFRFE